MHRTKNLLLLVVLVFATASTISLHAAPGDLDRTFSNDGRVLPTAYAASVAIQSDGKIVIAGGGQSVFSLIRYNTNGSIDNSFGVDGTVTTNFGDPDCFAASVVIQNDGKIVAAGYSGYGSNYRFALARFNGNGSLDLSFDGDGKLTTTIGSDDSVASVALQADGKIVAAGKGGGEYPNGYGAIVRYNSDGSLDAAFDGDGIVITPASFGHSTFTSVVIQGDDRIIATGTGNYSSIAVVRYTANGMLDPTFGQAGRTLLYIDVGLGENYGSAAALQPDGKVVLVGSAQDFDGFHFEGVVARLNPNGSLDASFGLVGIVTTQTGQYSWLSGLAVQTDGKIVVVGSAYFYEFLVMRYNANGSLDTSYGNAGKVIVDFWGLQSGASGVALDSIGRAVAVGSGIARLLGDIAAPLPAEFDFDGDGRSDICVFRPADSVWYLNRSTDGFSATQFGLPSDDIAPADYDGDDKTDIAVFRDGVWWRINSSTSAVTAEPFGQSGDVPVPADYTGDGRAEIAVYRNGQWLMRDHSNGQTSQVNFGLDSDRPVPADYDGDGKTDVGIFRPSSGEWWIQRSTAGLTVQQFGISTDTAVPADYTGDGKADIAVFRNTTGQWYIRRSEDSSFLAFGWGSSGDIPAPGDYDGDGKVDAAIFRGGQWWILQSSTASPITTQFGVTGDLPVPSAYVP